MTYRCHARLPLDRRSLLRGAIALTAATASDAGPGSNVPGPAARSAAVRLVGAEVHPHALHLRVELEGVGRDVGVDVRPVDEA